MLAYAAMDTKVLLPLAEILDTRVEEAGLELAAEIEGRALPAISWMVSAGLPFDADGWRGHLDELEDKKRQLTKELDQLAPEVKRYVRAPEGRTLVKADYSQIELRIAAKVSGDKKMLEAYQNGDDLHLLTAKSLAHSGVGKEDRKLAKAVNFGLLYGQRARGFREFARDKYETDITCEEAALYKRRFFGTYPGLHAWHKRESQKLKPRPAP